MDTSIGSETSDTSSSEAPLVGVDGRAFSLKALVGAIVALGAGSVIGGFVPIVGSLGRVVGILAAAFVLGLGFSRRRYFEVGIGGAVVGVGSALLGLVSASVLPVGMHVLQEYGLGFGAVGAALGVLLALVGHYFGRDLRAGLTQDIDV